MKNHKCECGRDIPFETGYDVDYEVDGLEDVKMLMKITLLKCVACGDEYYLLDRTGE